MSSKFCREKTSGNKRLCHLVPNKQLDQPDKCVYSSYTHRCRSVKREKKSDKIFKTVVVKPTSRGPVIDLSNMNVKELRQFCSQNQISLSRNMTIKEIRRRIMDVASALNVEKTEVVLKEYLPNEIDLSTVHSVDDIIQFERLRFKALNKYFKYTNYYKDDQLYAYLMTFRPEYLYLLDDRTEDTYNCSRNDTLKKLAHSIDSTIGARVRDYKASRNDWW